MDQVWWFLSCAIVATQEESSGANAIFSELNSVRSPNAQAILCYQTIQPAEKALSCHPDGHGEISATFKWFFRYTVQGKIRGSKKPMTITWDDPRILAYVSLKIFYQATPSICKHRTSARYGSKKKFYFLRICPNSLTHNLRDPDPFF